MEIAYEEEECPRRTPTTAERTEIDDGPELWSFNADTDPNESASRTTVWNEWWQASCPPERCTNGDESTRKRGGGTLSSTIRWPSTNSCSAPKRPRPYAPVSRETTPTSTRITATYWRRSTRRCTAKEAADTYLRILRASPESGTANTSVTSSTTYPASENNDRGETGEMCIDTTPAEGVPATTSGAIFITRL